ncbi:MAG: orotidine-5'-phosphate decarboxylase [Christensenellaceae bacterium]|jgi:orotidine-5'-phosphate decarboxylase|nr:orotidine-5'-phosphate decarboxylase [Christensenellaceae bacterium]
MGRDVIIACDFSSKMKTLGFLACFRHIKPFIKIGMELYYKEGPSIVTELKEKGYKIFLDLKLHDIPNTVHKAMCNLSQLGVDMINCHASGGIQMMQAAVAGIKEGAKSALPILIAVTQLTSTSEEMLKKELLIQSSLVDTVKHYAENALVAGINGVVCSPLEASIVKELGLLSVTPGIRFADANDDDQKRIATPELAKAYGSDYIVVGRPITNAANPVDAYNKCLEQFLDKDENVNKEIEQDQVCDADQENQAEDD